MNCPPTRAIKLVSAPNLFSILDTCASDLRLPSLSNPTLHTDRNPSHGRDSQADGNTQDQPYSILAGLGSGYQATLLLLTLKCRLRNSGLLDRSDGVQEKLTSTSNDGAHRHRSLAINVNGRSHVVWGFGRDPWQKNDSCRSHQFERRLPINRARSHLELP